MGWGACPDLRLCEKMEGWDSLDKLPFCSISPAAELANL